MHLNKKSLQTGGQMIPNQPGMSEENKVDPMIQQISSFFSSAIESGKQPEEVVMSLMDQKLNQDIIVQALMVSGYDQDSVSVIFENISKMQEPGMADAQEVNSNPQELARNEQMEKDSMGLPLLDDIQTMEMAKSGIEIKPENKGKFTRWAKARGMSVQEAAKKVMANKDRYPASVVKMANFAKNAAKFKKEEGGEELLQAQIGNKEVQYINSVGKDKEDNEEEVSEEVIVNKDKGIFGTSPFYINPILFQGAGNEFNPANLVNSVASTALDLFGEDGAARDLRRKTIQNKLDKYANARYTYNPNTSPENLQTIQNYINKYQKENPNVEEGIKSSDVIDLYEEDVKDFLNTNDQNLENTIGSDTYNALSRFLTMAEGGSLPKAQFSMSDGLVDDGNSLNNLFNNINSPNYFRDLLRSQAQTDYMEDTKLVSDAQLREQFPGLDPTPAEQQTQRQLDELNGSDQLGQIDYGTVDIDTGGVDGFLDRALNSNLARIGSTLAGGTVDIFSALNPLSRDRQYVDAKIDLRNQMGADFRNPVYFDPEGAKGNFALNDFLFRGESNRVATLDEFGKEGKELKPIPSGNKGLPELSESVRNTMGYMKYGGPKGEDVYLARKDAAIKASLEKKQQGGGGVPGEQIPGMPTKEQLDLLVYMNNYKNSFMADGYKPSQSEFDAMPQETKEMYVQSFPGNYKISSDTPTIEELNAITNKMQMGGIPGQQIAGMPTKAQLDAITGVNEIQFVPMTPQYEFLSSLPEQSVDFQLPNFKKDSSYNKMLVTRLFNDSELMKLPSQSENFQLDNYQKRMEMGGNPFNSLKAFTGDLEEYQDRGEVNTRRSKAEIQAQIAKLQNQINDENSRIEDFRSNIDKIYRGFLTSKETDNQELRQQQLNEILGENSSINPNLFNVTTGPYGGNVVGLDSIPKATLNWGSNLFDNNAGYGCTSYGCGILRQAGATTEDGKPFPIISGNSQLNSMIERNEGGLGMQLMEPGFTDLKPGDRVVSNYSTSGGSGAAHTMIFTGDYDDNGSPIMMENSGGNWKTGVNYRPLSEIKQNRSLDNPDDRLRVTRYVGSSNNLNNQLSALQSELDSGNYLREPVLSTNLKPSGIVMPEIQAPMGELLLRNDYGGEKGEAAYLANRNKVIQREMSKAKQGGETINVDSKMLAKLIAAGADIEML